MLRFILRISTTLILACLSALLVFALPFVILFLLQASAGPVAFEDKRALVLFLIILGLNGPAVLGLAFLWLPMLLTARQSDYFARERAILLAPLPFVVVALGREAIQVLSGHKEEIDFSFVPAITFYGPAAMISAAFFLYYDRLWTRLGSGRARIG
jgi:hypothetical protein